MGARKGEKIYFILRNDHVPATAIATAAKASVAKCSIMIVLIAYLSF
jgi:hypothetical protein